MVLDSGLIKELDGCLHWFLSLRSVVSSLEKPLRAGCCGIHLKFSFPYYWLATMPKPTLFLIHLKNVKVFFDVFAINFISGSI